MRDLTNLDYFQVDYRFIIDTDDPPGASDVIFPGTYDPEYKKGTVTSFLITTSAYPNIWRAADSLAKSAYSTILADLGQVQASPNILTNPVVLQHFTSNFGQLKLGRDFANAQPGPAREDYSSLQSTTGPLIVKSSTINAKYLCQIPQRKSIGNLLLSILVADLVLLQGLWKLFKLAVDAFCAKDKDISPEGDAEQISK